MDDPVIDLANTHLKEMLSWLKTLVYGIFALTFGFYLALFKSRILGFIQGLSGRLLVVFLLAATFGNGWWMFFCYRTSLRVVELSKFIERASGVENERFMDALNLPQYYVWAPMGLVLINWIGWTVIVFAIWRMARPGQAGRARRP